MREVKFVGKAVMSIEDLEVYEIAHENGWVTGNLIQGTQPFIVGGIVDGGADYINHEFFVQVVPGTERQFTGLKDKNGREVYEGDLYQYTSTSEIGIGGKIIKTSEVNRIKPIVFEEGAFYHGHDLLADVIEYDNTFTYVGNIYEHPHLLGGNQSE